MSSLEERALAFATAAHGSIDQRRKYTDEPYIVHPIAVADLVRSVYHDAPMIAAALLHDVVEDVAPHRPEFGLAQIEAAFGAEVAELVDWLTDVSKPQDGNRAARKAIDRDRLAPAPGRAQTIKVADLIDNSKSILAFDPEFAKVYLPEKQAMLAVLRRANPKLVGIARRQISAALDEVRT